ncbi:hypothetical protein BJ508DRAFT_320874 [Ascobolus immersus RN42]|uniref:Uncharacterized protein n=1 Tax=Ascobolus immersus RN42 TaxID=1160509 RepID=A0A3N4ILG7_ASCIM|nr:hypothetical protein BJ508DRAFT_320874 [Ascobolus immersus RN42]
MKNLPEGSQPEPEAPAPTSTRTKPLLSTESHVDDMWPYTNRSNEPLDGQKRIQLLTGCGAPRPIVHPLGEFSRVMSFLPRNVMEVWRLWTEYFVPDGLYKANGFHGRVWLNDDPTEALKLLYWVRDGFWIARTVGDAMIGSEAAEEFAGQDDILLLYHPPVFYPPEVALIKKDNVNSRNFFPHKGPYTPVRYNPMSPADCEHFQAFFREQRDRLMAEIAISANQGARLRP